MKLLAVAEGLAAEPFLERMNFEPLVAETLDVIREPIPEDVAFLRREVLATLRRDVQVLALSPRSSGSAARAGCAC